MLHLNNVDEAIKSLNNCDLSKFIDPNNSFRKFILKLSVGRFRHISNLDIEFTHPVTVISGSNKIGKTSLLLLMACSHENFLKIDSTTTETTLKPHAWRDVLRITKHEVDSENYNYKMTWRIGHSNFTGEGKRVNRAWTGLGKKSQVKRQNAKIKNFQVRLIDLDRVGPVRNFSRSLQSKVKNTEVKEKLNDDIAMAFSYIFDLSEVNIYKIGEHITKRCYLVEPENSLAYSSYNTASGEDAVISILVDLFETPDDALILIDELEAGFHPTIQRKLANIIQYVAWRQKKQFIITTHSPTLMASFPQESRRFIETNDGVYTVIPKISAMAAFSKMDIYSHPLIRLYCEDNVACFLVQKVINEITRGNAAFHKLVNIITSGPANQVKEDFLNHRRIFEKMLPKIGYCCVFDGDYKNTQGYKEFSDNNDEGVFFLFPYEAPEKFLAKAYLQTYPDTILSSYLCHSNHHDFFKKMCELGIATDENDARNLCFEEFKKSLDYFDLNMSLHQFLINRVAFFSSCID